MTNSVVKNWVDNLLRPEVQAALGPKQMWRFLGKALSVSVEDARLEEALLEIPSETTPEERRFLCNLMSCLWSGVGDVVEIGPYLGGTTRALALGMLRNPHRSPTTRLRTYDTFQGYGTPESFCNFLKPLFDRGTLPQTIRGELIAQGADFRFLSVFEKLHGAQPYAAFLEVFDSPAASTPQELNSGKSIMRLDPKHRYEVVFVDGCKSWFGTKYFMQQAVACSGPGTLHVFQDYRWYTCFWISAFMFVMRDCFELVAAVDSTYAFRQTQPITAELINDRFPNEPEVLGAELLTQIFSALIYEAGDRGDLDLIVAHKLHLVGALAYVGEKDRAREVLAQLSQEPYAACYRDIIEKSAKSPTYRPGEGVYL